MSENKKVILSFDVEFWNESDWLKPFITKEMLQIDTFPESIDKILHLLEKNRGFATFFITMEVVKKYPEVVKKISGLGHEVGIHGPKHIKLEYYNKEEFRKDCIEEINLLEQITGKKPIGYRAPHFSINKKTWWTLGTLRDLGFKYDSSIFPMKLGEYGISGVPTSKHIVVPDLTELPITIAKFGKIKLPFAGGVYFRILPLFVLKWLINKSTKNETPVLYFHPHELDPKTPQIKKGPWLKRKLKYFGVGHSFKKFEKLSDCYIFDSIKDNI